MLTINRNNISLTLDENASVADNMIKSYTKGFNDAVSAVAAANIDAYELKDGTVVIPVESLQKAISEIAKTRM